MKDLLVTDELAAHKLTDPAPFFYDAGSEQVLFLEHQLVFSLPLEALVCAHDLLEAQAAEAEDLGGSDAAFEAGVEAPHYFGTVTKVVHVSDPLARRMLGTARSILPETPLCDALVSWGEFCIDVADELAEGQPLADALANVWARSAGHA